jgi:hypothetical protein
LLGGYGGRVLESDSFVVEEIELLVDVKSEGKREDRAC